MRERMDSIERERKQWGDKIQKLNNDERQAVIKRWKEVAIIIQKNSLKVIFAYLGC